MNIEPRLLIQIAAVVEAGGMTEAAALARTSQPAISRSISMLEKRLGAPLFLRDRRPLQPTVLGQKLAEQGLIIRRSAELASQATQSFQEGNLGVVRLGGTPYFTDALVTKMVARFQSEHRGVKITISYGYTDHLIASTRAGRLDIAVCPMELLDSSIDNDLSFEELLQGRNVVACRNDHPLHKERSIKAKELLRFPWIEPPPDSPLNSDLHSILLSFGIDRVQMSIAGASLGGVLNYLQNSDCLAVLPQSVVLADRDQARIAALPVKLAHPPRALGILRSARNVQLPATERLQKHLVHEFRGIKDLIRRHEGVKIWGRP